MYLPVLFSALALRVFLVLRDSAPFAYDMGRDLLWTKDIAFYLTPTLIGPAASIWGVYFGPFWYYFLAFPLFISNGHPLSAVLAAAVAVVLTGHLSYIFFKKYLGKFYAYTLMILLLFNSSLINISTFAFHANVLPLLTLLMLYFCFLAVINNPKYIALAFLSASLMFSADPAPAVVASFVPVVSFIYFKLYKKDFVPAFLYSIIAYAAPFIPQMLFELRNNFIETRSLLAYFLGTNPSLSGALPIIERIINRADVFSNFFSSGFASGNNLYALLLLIFTSLGLYRFLKSPQNPQSQKRTESQVLFKLAIICLAVSAFIFTFPFNVEVKNWYLYGISVPISILIAFSISALKKQKLLVYFLLGSYVFINLIHFFNWDKRNLGYRDPAQLINQVSALNYIYEDAASSKFAVYIFTPPIYDLQYQYLFWWQGIRLKKGLPTEFAYLPNQPEYVRNKTRYAVSPKISNTIYLIIENSSENPNYSKKEWLKKFRDYKIVWDKNINNAITIQKRSK